VQQRSVFTGEQGWIRHAAEIRRPAATPRPTFDGIAHVARHEAALHLWGNDDAGDVADWVYASTDKIHHLVFGMAPGQAFVHSPDFRTVFGADEVLFVVSGVMVLANPQTGEVLRVQSGQAACFGPDTWHHALSFGPDALRVVEFFAPPPATGASSAYARTKEYLEDSIYVDPRWHGRWPAAEADARAAATMRLLTDADLWWSAEGAGTLIGTMLSTPNLWVARVVQRSGARSGARVHRGDAALHVLRGTVFLLNLDAPGQRWFEAGPGDGLYVPAGATYELRNVTAEESEVLVAVAPNELAEVSAR
jgi:mannose-6-phosphate isomerase-like protein (cupin superfamily)